MKVIFYCVSLVIVFSKSHVLACDESLLENCLINGGGLGCYKKFYCSRDKQAHVYCSLFDYDICEENKGGVSCANELVECHRALINYYNEKLDFLTKVGAPKSHECHTKSNQCDDFNRLKMAREKLLEMNYINQYSNGLDPESSCANTSVAMVLNFLNPKTKTSPDNLTAGKFGLLTAQSPEGISKIIQTNGINSKSTRSGRVEDLKYHLSEGRPVIVNGWFTNAGHVLVVVGYDPKTNEYIVKDPAGKWNQKWKQGYAGRDGNNVRYKAWSFENAIKTTKYGEKSKIWMNVSSSESDFSIKVPENFKFPEREICEGIENSKISSN